VRVDIKRRTMPPQSNRATLTSSQRLPNCETIPCLVCYRSYRPAVYLGRLCVNTWSTARRAAEFGSRDSRDSTNRRRSSMLACLANCPPNKPSYTMHLTIMSIESDIIHRYREAIHEFLAAWDDWEDERLIPSRLAEALGTLRSIDANPGPQDI
jgi:hypothetical protein